MCLVSAPPAIKKGYDSEIIRAGGDLVLPCVTNRGNPPPRVRWMRFDADGSWKRVDQRYTNRTNASAVTLVIRNAANNQSGMYQCVARNKIGKDSWDVRISIGANFFLTRSRAEKINGFFTGKPSLPADPHLHCVVKSLTCRLTWKRPEYAGHVNTTDFTYMIFYTVNDNRDWEHVLTHQLEFVIQLPANVTTLELELYSYTASSGQSAIPAKAYVDWEKEVRNAAEDRMRHEYLDQIENVRKRTEQRLAFLARIRSSYLNDSTFKSGADVVVDARNVNTPSYAVLIIAVCTSVCLFPLLLTSCLLLQMHIRIWWRQKGRGGYSGTGAAGRLPPALVDMLSHRTPSDSNRVRFQDTNDDDEATSSKV